MLIIRRGWAKSSLIGFIQTKVGSSFLFSSEINFTKLKQIHSSLVTDYRKLKPQKTIRMLHYINAKSLGMKGQSMLRPAEVDQILQNLSSQLGTMTHADITLLLQTLSQLPAFSKYNRNNEFMKSLIKRLSMIQAIKLDSNYMFRLLNVLEKMKFPVLVINKYINVVLGGTAKTGMANMDVLRFFICILEMKFVHVSLVQKLYEKQFKTINLSTPHELTYMYYLLKTLQQSLQIKLTYLSDKLKVHALVSSAEEVNQNSGQQAPFNPAQRQRQRMIQISENLVNQMKKQIDKQKLKQNLCKFYDFEKYPLDTPTALILHDLVELRPALLAYMKTKFLKMQPSQFIALLPSTPQSERIKYYDQYVKRVWKHLPIMQKLLMVNCKDQLCKVAVTKQSLISIIKQSKSISTPELQAIAYMSQKYLKEDDQLEVIKSIEDIIGDINEK